MTPAGASGTFLARFPPPRRRRAAGPWSRRCSRALDDDPAATGDLLELVLLEVPDAEEAFWVSVSTRSGPSVTI